MRRLVVALSLVVMPSALAAQAAHPDSSFLSSMRWRSIGPANMAGRVSGVAGNPRNPSVVYAAYASGGVWKTTNAGTTWANVGDNANIYSASEIAIAPSDTSVIWVGTGEEDSRNSISPGAGVFKSTNGGRTWTFMGLRATNQIGRIVIHPTDPNTVYIAALGRAWGPNPERGVYKTTDGGTTWTLVKFISPRAGAVDIAMDPRDPNHLIAAFWERVRGPYFLNSGGPGSGLWNTTDAGATWTPVGGGLPTTTFGRAGLAWAPSNGAIVYTIVEADSAPNPESVRAARVRGFVPDTTRRAKLQSGMFRSNDGGSTWERMNSENDRPFYYSQLRVDPGNPDRLYWFATQARYSNDGGRTLRQIGAAIHTDYHALWIDPNNTDHLILGQDGGLAQSWDRGRTYDAWLQMAVGQFYQISMDMQRPFWVCGGLQDNGTWCGPSESPRGRITNADWTNIGGGDGFWTAQDPTDPDIVYSESQGGNVQRRNLRTWESRGIRPGTFPAPGGGGFGGGLTLARMLEDSLVLARGDTSQPASPEAQRVVDSLRIRIARDTSQITRNRFNWSTPFFISSHNSRTLYLGGHRVYKTVNRGDSWVPISEDLSQRDTAKIRLSLVLTGGITRDASGAETQGTVVALAESPVRPGILFAGTDDGNVWMTRNDGTAWESLNGRFPGAPRGLYVSRVRASAFDSNTVYVTFDGHRSDDFHPYVFVSNDLGRTFRSLSATLPDSEYVNVITEDPRRRELLFVGTEMGAYVSLDLGATWSRFMAGLPTVPVHDLEVHPRDRTLVAGTHGRSIYVVEIGALEQATDSVLGAPAHLFAPDVALLYSPRAGGGGVGAVGSKLFIANNPAFGARIQLRITAGDAPQVARGPGAPGAPGDAAAPGAPGAPVVPAEPQEGEGAPPAGAGGGGGGGGGGFGGGAGLAPRPVGDSVTITITNGSGDTVRTLYTNARRAPLRLITWDLRQNRAPLGPAAVRDSIRAAQRRQFVQDSTRAAARDTTAGPGGRRGGQFAGRDPTPGEPGTNVNMTGNNYGLFPGGGGGGGGFGGVGGLVEPGIYLITVRFNGREYKQSVRVERPSAIQSALSGGWQ